MGITTMTMRIVCIADHDIVPPSLFTMRTTESSLQVGATLLQVAVLGSWPPTLTHITELKSGDYL